MRNNPSKENLSKCREEGGQEKKKEKEKKPTPSHVWLPFFNMHLHLLRRGSVSWPHLLSAPGTEALS